VLLNEEMNLDVRLYDVAKVSVVQVVHIHAVDCARVLVDVGLTLQVAAKQKFVLVPCYRPNKAWIFV